MTSSRSAASPASVAPATDWEVVPVPDGSDVHLSYECVQIGGDLGTVEKACEYVAGLGCHGILLSHFHIMNEDGTFRPVDEVRQVLKKYKLRLDGVSSHVLWWPHGSAWTGTKSWRPYAISNKVRAMNPVAATQWHEDACLRLMDWCVEARLGVLPMFWGVYWGFEVACGYHIGNWKWGNPAETELAYDLIAEGNNRFLTTTAKLRGHANDNGLILADELHLMSGMLSSSCFSHVVKVAEDDPCLGVWIDESHCWIETPTDRFQSNPQVAARSYFGHGKNLRTIPGRPLLSMITDFADRGEQFCDLEENGVGDAARLVCMARETGAIARTCKRNGTTTAPFALEIEHPHKRRRVSASNDARYAMTHVVVERATRAATDLGK